MSSTGPTTCVVVSVTDDFVPGALVTLHSFQKHNPWFDGDIVVISDGLSEANQAGLADRFDGLRFVDVSGQLKQWIDTVIDIRPELKSQASQFYSLDVFRVGSTYSKALYLDCDLLFRKDIEELWQRPEPFLCCRDGPAYRGFGRDRTTFDSCEVTPHSLNDTFNSGFMLIDGSLLTESEFDRILNSVSFEAWNDVSIGHTDQLVLNHALAGYQHLLPSEYNFLLKHLQVMQNQTDSNIDDAAVLHFNLNAKPWQPHRILGAAIESPLIYDSFNWWNASYIECMKEIFLRRKIRAGKG